MASLEKEIKQEKFANEHIKANLNILFTANWLYNKISADLKPLNITHEQLNVLRILRGSLPNCMSQKDILSRMISPSSNLTLIIKKLVAKAWVSVQQSDRDKREYMIDITQKGMELLQKIDVVFENNKLMYNNLNESEAFHLNALLDKLREE
ncbi:MAG: MarR family transcriptional regulator [Saprospiraceae bacterium]